MGLLRQYFHDGNLAGCEDYIQSLWSGRHASNTFKSSDADDAVWLLGRTQENPALQRQLWPKLLGLLTRWAFLAARGGSSSSTGSARSSASFLLSLQKWLAAHLASPKPWAVRAPALLLIAVIGTSVITSAPSPLQIACQSLASQLLLPSPRLRPAAELLLGSLDAVTDLCTAVELVSLRLVVTGDWRAFVELLAALLATLGAALGEICSGIVTAAANTDSPQPQAQEQLPSLTATGGIRTPPCLAPVAAAAHEEAAAALAALHASCRQLGSACARAVLASATAAAGVSATSMPTVLVIGASAAAAAPGGSGGLLPSAAAAALAALAGHVRTITAKAQVVRSYGDPQPTGRRRVVGCTVEPAASVGWLGSAAVADEQDPWVAASVAVVVAGGLLEGCVVAVRLQPLGRPQELLLHQLQPCTDLLSVALREAAVAMPMLGSGRPGGAGGAGCSSPCALDADPRVVVLNMALGYVWSRLRSQAPLPGPLQPALSAADGMSAAAAAAATADEGRWHPARGALAVLMIGSLGVGRLLQLALAGSPPGSAAELLEEHTRGALFADTQLLAKAVVEATHGTVSAPSSQVSTTPTAAMGPIVASCQAALVDSLLSDAATAARRLYVLYGGVADAVAGRAWLATLPSAATGNLRELLDRAFVCMVSILAAAYGKLSASLPPLPAAAASGTPPGRAAAAPEARAAAAATALGALADLQFCAIQLRAHGDLVARLSSDVLSAPAAALPSLLAQLPCYPAFAAVYGANGGGFTAAPIATSRLAFLLPLASSCVPRAPDAGAAACEVLPYIYLLLKGAPESVVQAAHSTWAALLVNLCEKRTAITATTSAATTSVNSTAMHARKLRTDAGPSDANGRALSEVACERSSVDGEVGLSTSAVALAASMVPYYIDRTCQAPCSVADLELLEWGLRQVLQSLPEAHPMKAWVTARLCRQLRDWATTSWAETIPAPAATAGPGFSLPAPSELPLGKSSQGQRPTDRSGSANGYGSSGLAAHGCPDQAESSDMQALASRCAGAVASVAMALDFVLIPQALHALTTVLHGLGPSSVVVLQQLHDTWLSSNDYARKQLLEGWWRQFVITSRLQGRLY